MVVLGLFWTPRPSPIATGGLGADAAGVPVAKGALGASAEGATWSQLGCGASCWGGEVVRFVLTSSEAVLLLTGASSLESLPDEALSFLIVLVLLRLRF